MKNELFNYDIVPHCAVCARCRPAPTENEMLCFVLGVVQADHVCNKFKYDPLKREPRTIKLRSDLNAEDFKL